MTTEEELARELKASTKAIDEMFRAVGQAISDWGLVEEGLFEVFFRLIGSRAMGPPSCTFMAADNMWTKLKMIDSMMRHSKAGRKVLTEWEELQASCNKLIMSRNAIVHRRVTMIHIGRAKGQPALVGYRHDLRNALEEEYAVPSHIKVDRVKELSTEFKQLGADLAQFAGGIRHS
jgi:hypothetical protein